MGLDFEKLKKTSQEIQARMNRGGSTSMKFWKPANGKNTVRILPPWTDEGELAGQFYREVHQHWNLSEDAGPALCPKKTPGVSADKDCPVCDFVEQLRARKSDVEAQELAKKLRAKVAYLMSIIDINDPEYTAKDVAEFKKDRPDSEVPFQVGDVKIQCYAATTTIADSIMNLVIANEMDITDLEAGFNLIITKVPNKDPLKTRYTVTPELKKTVAPVAADTKLPDLGNVGKVKSAEDLLKLLTEGPAGSFAGLLSSGDNTKAGGDTSWTGGEEADDLAAEMRAQIS